MRLKTVRKGFAGFVNLAIDYSKSMRISPYPTLTLELIKTWKKKLLNLFVTSHNLAVMLAHIVFQ